MSEVKYQGSGDKLYGSDGSVHHADGTVTFPKGTLEKAVSQEHLTLDTVDAQFCSDWLKDEIKRFFAEIDVLRYDNHILEGRLNEAQTNNRYGECERDTYKEALEKIADPRKRDHQEPNAYTQLGCVMNIANEALEKIKNQK